MSFHVLDASLELVRQLRGPADDLTRFDPSLADQLRRAASSVGLNIAEGNRRRGRDRIHLFRVAAGSAAEVAATLRVAEAWGHVDGGAATAPLHTCDRVLAMLYRLTR